MVSIVVVVSTSLRSALPLASASAAALASALELPPPLSDALPEDEAEPESPESSLPRNDVVSVTVTEVDSSRPSSTLMPSVAVISAFPSIKTSEPWMVTAPSESMLALPSTLITDPALVPRNSSLVVVLVPKRPVPTSAPDSVVSVLVVTWSCLANTSKLPPVSTSRLPPTSTSLPAIVVSAPLSSVRLPPTLRLEPMFVDVVVVVFVNSLSPNKPPDTLLVDVDSVVVSTIVSKVMFSPALKLASPPAFTSAPVTTISLFASMLRSPVASIVEVTPTRVLKLRLSPAPSTIV